MEQRANEVKSDLGLSQSHIKSEKVALDSISVSQALPLVWPRDDLIGIGHDTPL
jgi:hypothetical protein